MSVVRDLDTIVRKVMDGATIRLPADGPTIAAQCAYRLIQLGYDQDMRAILGIVEADIDLCWFSYLIDGVSKALDADMPGLALVTLEGAVRTLTPERQASLFALAIVIDSIADAKDGPIDGVGSLTPETANVRYQIDWLFKRDCWNADNAAVSLALGEALRDNAALWQATAGSVDEPAGE